MEAKNITAIAGFNGSGKTRFVEQMRRQMASDTLRYVAFCDSYGAQTDRAYYLQQRWNQHDIDQETPTVEDVLQRTYTLTGPDTMERQALRQRLTQMLALETLLDKYVIMLSSGELRKLQLAKTLLARPRTLILDNPFIGLDMPTRTQLRELLLQLATDDPQLAIYIVVARQGEIPDYVGNTVWITPPEDFCTPPAATMADVMLSMASLPAGSDWDNNQGEETACYTAEPVAELHHVSIRYGERTILHDLDWTIRKGEHWALSGRNGSGKSTLLSLICADNPQGYACDISLFGRQRGSGETIWDIKRRIGYVSPEMHRSYRHNLPAMQIVASGLKDTVGLYTRANRQEQQQCQWWMRLFGLEGKEQQPFLTLSSGEQRLVLLARAFVKDPDLLILDEPLHGLDDRNQQHVKDIIDTFCQRRQKTLIMVTHYEEELPSCIDHWKTLA